MCTYRLHEETENYSSGWKIKWFGPFRLGSLGKYGLSFEAMQFLYSSFSLFSCHLDVRVFEGLFSTGWFCKCLVSTTGQFRLFGQQKSA